ncbi:MAG: hypothetical protein GF411_13950 [Candidatus Lokiarchaeota archaeon]|nr:hypothetical protein [Candidatus Lokiarchaeota archaeon]
MNLIEKIKAVVKVDRFLFWMCAIGEPFMRPDFKEIMTALSADHKVCPVTNLAYFGNDTPEYLTTINTKNIGMYWSVHWAEMKKHKVLAKTIERVSIMIESGIKIWPTIVAHPCYFNLLDDVLEAMKQLGLKLLLCRYRIGQSDLAQLEEEKQIEDKYRSHPNVDMSIWDITPEAWKVAGGVCESGHKALVIDAWWRMATCHGDGNPNFFGSFPEDINKLPSRIRTPGICKSSKCPCKHLEFWGVNRKFPRSFADILYKWEEFMSS